jgi:hypothetical protein
MIAITQIASVAVVAWTLCGTAYATDATQTVRPTVITDVDFSAFGGGKVNVIGAFVHGKGWVDSEKADGLMPEDAELDLYDLREGAVGSATLTSAGKLGSEFTDGLWYECRVSLDGGRMARYQERYWRELHGEEGPELPELALVGVWHSAGSPVSAWVKAETLSPENVVYRRVISDWLKEKGVSAEIIAGVVVEQIVRADINQDGKDEVFLSFRTPEMVYSVEQTPTKAAFSYLLLRYLPRGSSQARDIVLTARPYLVHKVTGLCDLDGDGWAEVTATMRGVDQWGSFLYHWKGEAFERVGGWGGGC